MKFCECGCGEPAPISSTTDASRGYVKGEPHRFIVGHHRRLSPIAYLVDPDTGCWLWQRGRSNNGYGTAHLDGRKYLAHRLAYVQTHGPVPDGYELHHVCGTRACVNPDHLEAITRLEHVGRHAPKACKHGHEFTPENTIATRAGHRGCRVCKRAADARQRAKAKGTA